MGLFLRSNGYYYIQYNNNGQKVQKSLKTKNKFFAKDLYHAFLREKLLKEFFPPVQTIPHFFDIEARTDSEKPLKSLITSYKEYIKDCVSRGLGKRSMEDKNHFLKIITRYKLTKFEALTPDNVNKFWDELKKSYAPDTIRKISCNLKSFLNYAIRQDDFTESQLKKLTFPKITVNVREAIYSDELWLDIQKLASKDKDFLLYLKTLYYTGCRPSEIVDLQRKNIDDNGSVRIFQNKTKLKKTIIIPPFLLKDMGQGFIFKGHDKQPEYYGKKFRKLRLKLGLSTEYSLYTFRHTFATNLLNKTSDIHLVSKALGHTNIMMTAKHYANRTSKDIQDRVSVLWDNNKRSSK